MSAEEAVALGLEAVRQKLAEEAPHD
jgi:hypothetical protein